MRCGERYPRGAVESSTVDCPNLLESDRLPPRRIVEDQGMFTGIIEHVGTVAALSPTPAGKRLTIDLGPLSSDLRDGESVAVEGVCLTAAARSGTTASFDVIPETLSRTSLGRLGPGSRVNLERSLRVGDRLGGHFVQGHVDATGTVARLDRAGEAVTLEIAIPPGFADLLIEKGSVAIAGVSLTVVQVRKDRFTVALIPFTLEHTTLGALRSGDPVNLEGDLIGKWVQKLVSGEKEAGVTMELLRQGGFAV